MTLASSGSMSIGGSTTARSINVELGRSATATSNMGETDLRSLAGVSSGAISMSNFYGKSNYKFITTITIEAKTIFGQAFRGFGSVGNPSSPTTFGSASDTTVDLYSDTPSGNNFGFYSLNGGNTFLRINSSDSNNPGNSGWTSLDLFFGPNIVDGTFATAQSSTTVNRTDLTYSGTSGSGLRIWNMGDGGQTNGTFTLGSNVKVTLAFR